MSKRIIGKWEDGSAKRCYFRKTRHYRIKSNGFPPIRRIMYFAHEYKWDCQMYKKYNQKL
jgi:hypothetical protein